MNNRDQYLEFEGKYFNFQHRLDLGFNFGSKIAGRETYLQNQFLCGGGIEVEGVGWGGIYSRCLFLPNFMDQEYVQLPFVINMSLR